SVVRCAFLRLAAPAPETNTLSLHDALPISCRECPSHECLMSLYMLNLPEFPWPSAVTPPTPPPAMPEPCLTWPRIIASVRRCCRDRKSTRLNSSHVKIAYADFCVQKKNGIE